MGCTHMSSMLSLHPGAEEWTLLPDVTTSQTCRSEQTSVRSSHVLRSFVIDSPHQKPFLLSWSFTLNDAAGSTCGGAAEPPSLARSRRPRRRVRAATSSPPRPRFAAVRRNSTRAGSGLVCGTMHGSHAGSRSGFAGRVSLLPQVIDMRHGHCLQKAAAVQTHRTSGVPGGCRAQSIALRSPYVRNLWDCCRRDIVHDCLRHYSVRC